MISEFDILNWDSTFFGYPVAKISAKTIHAESELNDIINQLKKNQIKLAYLIVPETDLQTLFIVKQRFVPVTTNITLRRPVTQNDLKTTNEVTEYMRKQPVSELYDLALQAGHDSRYKLDVQFTNNEFERLYRLWIENSVNKSFADYTFVWQIDNTIKGFVTLKVNNETGVIGLIAVDETTRGKGAGKKLLEAVFNKLAKKKITFCDVATQKENTGAVKFYETNGFSIIRSDVYFHIWL